VTFVSAAARGRTNSRSRSGTRGSTARRRKKGSGGARRKRAPARQRTKAAARVRRRRFIAGGVVAAALAVVGVTQLGVFDDTIREVTLPLRHEDIIRQQARDKGVDPALIAGVIYAESRFVDQTSHAGARGLMQVTPDTANGIEQRSGGTTFDPSTDLSDPQINIQYGTYYLDELLARYEGNEVAALAAYNAGPGNADAWGGSELELDEIEFAETREYVDQVLTKRDEYTKNYARELGLD
jgi:soluble lytic murein transglycosylase